MMNGAEYYDYLVTAYTNAGTLQDQQWLQPYLKEQNFDWWDFCYAECFDTELQHRI